MITRINNVRKNKWKGRKPKADMPFPLNFIRFHPEMEVLRELRKWRNLSGDALFQEQSSELLAISVKLGLKRVSYWLLKEGVCPGREGCSCGALTEAVLRQDWTLAGLMLQKNAVIGTKMDLLRIINARESEEETNDILMFLSGAIPVSLLNAKEEKEEQENIFNVIMNKGWSETAKMLLEGIDTSLWDDLFKGFDRTKKINHHWDSCFSTLESLYFSLTTSKLDYDFKSKKRI